MLNITQDDYDIIKQQHQRRFIKLNVLDFEYRVVDEISGNLIDCTFNCDANSDLRRSCNVSLAVYGAQASKLNVEKSSEIFLDKFIQPYVGIMNNSTDEIQWYNQGIYLIDRPTWDWDAQTNILKFDGMDLMGKLTGARNGYLEGLPTVIKAGENVRQAIISVLELAGFTRYICSECLADVNSNVIQPVPNDIIINQGGTVYDVLAELRDILPRYQIYFDVDGVFHYDLIPSGQYEEPVLDDDLFGKLMISESVNTDFTTVKNYIEVYGRSHDVTYFSIDTHERLLSDGVIVLNLPNFDFDKFNQTIKFSAPFTGIMNRIYINDKPFPLKDDIGGITNVNVTQGTEYVIRYVQWVNDFGIYFQNVHYVGVYSGQSVDVICDDVSSNVHTGIIDLTIPDFLETFTDATIGFIAPFTTVGPLFVSINNGNTKIVQISDWPDPFDFQISEGEYYVLQYDDAYRVYYLGHQQAMGIAYENNPESPFYVNGPVGRIRYVCYGGEYDNIMSDNLAQQRAIYELYTRARLEDALSLYTIPIPWLDVNMLIRHRTKDDDIAKDYMIQSYSYSMGVGETMTIIANQYYPLYRIDNYRWSYLD